MSDNFKEKLLERQGELRKSMAQKTSEQRKMVSEQLPELREKAGDQLRKQQDILQAVRLDTYDYENGKVSGINQTTGRREVFEVPKKNKQ